LTEFDFSDSAESQILDLKTFSGSFICIHNCREEGFRTLPVDKDFILDNCGFGKTERDPFVDKGFELLGTAFSLSTPPNMAVLSMFSLLSVNDFVRRSPSLQV
jgi:hypothetical protein